MSSLGERHWVRLGCATGRSKSQDYCRRGEETGRQSVGAAVGAEGGKAYRENGLCKYEWDFFPGPQRATESIWWSSL